MKLQVAIDRTDLETAEAMIEEIKESADIIEIGTSLIKDYGLDRSVAYFRKRFPEQCFLADIKTCDEALTSSGKHMRPEEIFRQSWDFLP